MDTYAADLAKLVEVLDLKDDNPCRPIEGRQEVHHEIRSSEINQISNADDPEACTNPLLRFSTVGGEKGSADTKCDPRGFALKFYTEEGNWDRVGNNTPIFFIRDPFKFGDFIHTQKRDPLTNLKSPTMMWDFWSLSPESLHQVTILFSDSGASTLSARSGYFGVRRYPGTSRALRNI